MSSQDELASGSSPLERLSQREGQILKFVVEGKSTEEISTLLRLSPKSVESYRGRIMDKLEIEDLPSLVKFAIRNGVTTL